ncbi:hypothetical protein [Candidatus Clostridium stratigraminis]|uniref:Glucose / Sorbosone dehydrogenase n=1 Tax=Candidatus Clostridium stratigraminis TaxID=3381661 RepID=A0ABW8T7Z4_9CLOT
MKKYVILTAAVCSLIIIFIFFKGFYNNQYIDLKDNKLSYEIKYKGLLNAKDFTQDEIGNSYIAYKNKIQFIDVNGKSYDVLVDKNLNINSLEFYKDNLYFASNNKIITFDLKKKEQKVIINDLPNYGDYNESLIRIVGDDLYITIGAATNSGVVGPDNKWTKEYPFFFDLSPRNISLKGTAFGNEKTGAFVPYKTKNLKGQLIPGHFPGNGTIITYSLKSGTTENFAWGIRNIKGIDFNSEGKLIASVGGIENRGLRPLSGDADYIYEIKKGVWYGWPDYSGGDPVTSPRFKSENKNKIEFLLDNHPSSNPPAPIYQHKSLSALSILTIDNKAQVGEKDCMYFYDSKDNILYTLTKGNVLKEIAKLNPSTDLSAIRIYDKSLLLLDNKEGILYSLHINTNSNIFNLNKNIMYYLLFILLFSITIIVWKYNSSADRQ